MISPRPPADLPLEQLEHRRRGDARRAAPRSGSGRDSRAGRRRHRLASARGRPATDPRRVRRRPPPLQLACRPRTRRRRRSAPLSPTDSRPPHCGSPRRHHRVPAAAGSRTPARSCAAGPVVPPATARRSGRPPVRPAPATRRGDRTRGAASDHREGSVRRRGQAPPAPGLPLPPPTTVLPDGAGPAPGLLDQQAIEDELGAPVEGQRRGVVVQRQQVGLTDRP